MVTVKKKRIDQQEKIIIEIGAWLFVSIVVFIFIRHVL